MGEVWSWGGNGASGASSSGAPSRRSTLSDVVGVSGGTRAGYALKSDGTVWAWGFNENGELGAPPHTRWSAPSQVTGLDGIVALAGGSAAGYALKADGTVWAWGYNFWRELGDGTAKPRSTPVMVQGLSGVVAVAARHETAYALKSDGTVWAWGWNENAQAGRGAGLITRGLVPYQKVPVAIAGLPRVAAVAAGHYAAYALSADGTVWAWGCNNDGQLGNGGPMRKAVFPPVQVSDLGGVIAITAGALSAYALKSDGTVWGWGSNEFQQIDNGPTTDRRSPVRISGLTDVTTFAAGAVSCFAIRGEVSRNLTPSDNTSQSRRDPLSESVTRALQQMLLPSSGWRTRLSGSTLLASDGMLHSYWEVDIDWESIWMFVVGCEPGQQLPWFGSRPYWAPEGPNGRQVPDSVLAFCDNTTRLRIAEDPNTDLATLAMMANDFDIAVRDATRRRL